MTQFFSKKAEAVYLRWKAYDENAQSFFLHWSFGAGDILTYSDRPADLFDLMTRAMDSWDEMHKDAAK